MGHKTDFQKLKRAIEGGAIVVLTESNDGGIEVWSVHEHMGHYYVED